jgi:hypothetical protein
MKVSYLDRRPKMNTKYFVIANLESGAEIVDITDNRAEAEYLADEYSLAFQCPISISEGRRLDNWELCDLPMNWENPRVDTSKYHQSVMEAWEVDEGLYGLAKEWGDLCQKYDGRYFIAYRYFIA